ncbi:MAG: hypothetical protein AB8G99_01105 [Planctomycetaceae bacterium]
MQQVIPFTNFQDAQTSLDNGGRFFNILTKADDGVITGAELGKVAGCFADKQKMALFLDLAMAELSDSDKDQVVHMLSPDLRAGIDSHKPAWWLPSEALAQGVAGASAIVTGVPKLVESKTEFNGFIMVPIMTGTVTTFMMIPLVDAYDVYEVRDEASDEAFLVAHAKSSSELDGRRVQVAGVLKDLKESKEDCEASKLFLEVVYHRELE